MKPAPSPKAAAPWTFLTNHALVLLCIARLPESRLRDLAVRVGITERAVQRIVGELALEGYLRVVREGRRNRYELRPNTPLRHQLEGRGTAAALLQLAGAGAQVPPRSQGPRSRTEPARSVSFID